VTGSANTGSNLRPVAPIVTVASLTGRLAIWEHEWHRDVLHRGAASTSTAAAATPSSGPAAAHWHLRSRAQFIAVLDLATMVPAAADGVFLMHSLRTVASRRGYPMGVDGTAGVVPPSAAAQRRGTPSRPAGVSDDSAPAVVEVGNLGSRGSYPLSGKAGIITYRSFPMFGFVGRMSSGGFRLTFPAAEVQCRCCALHVVVHQAASHAAAALDRDT
jgi:hypothetical protein